ncbi:MAG: hypothetical protein IT577_04425 [Verrucomicrobiae bacterium]|nr:hypothetical protein [Verrucomicrobiae bacterium]
MSAAILQGVPATTIDTVIWVDLPSRQYFWLHALVMAMGGKPLAKTVVALSDDTLVNFLFSVTGLGSFEREWGRALRLRWLGTTVAVMPLRSIIVSKRAIRREKDIAHLPLLERTARLARLRRRLGDGA